MNDLMTKSMLNYVELKKQAFKDMQSDFSLDLEMGNGLTHPEEENLSQFFDQVESIKSEMEIISDLLTDLQNLHEQSKSIHSTKLLRGLRDRTDSNVKMILRKAKIIKTHITTLDHLNIANRLLSPAFQIGSPVDRSRISVSNGLRMKLRELMNEFQLLRDRIVAEHREGLKRKYFSATGEIASEELIDSMMSCSEKNQVFDEKHELGLEVLERNKAVSEIQRSLENLHQVFLDMAIVVETQGEKIDDIQENVMSAKEYISEGTNSLVSAEAMKRRREWLGWIWVLVMIVLMVCLIPIFTESS